MLSYKTVQLACFWIAGFGCTLFHIGKPRGETHHANHQVQSDPKLESELGYTVQTVDIDENAQWAAINTGDIDASLEVWPSGHADNVADYIDSADGNVDNAGLIGPVGEIGWFIPTYMVDQHPALATWEGFADPALAGLFAVAETGDKGQFLSGDPSWTIYDEQIIANLNLPIEIVYVGSEAGILAALDAAYSRQDPVLFYFWTPHSAFSTYDLTRVALPAYSDKCYAQADAGGIDCDYPEDVLFKIVNADLAGNAPDADAFLRAMNYSTADQISMLSAIENDGLSVEDAALNGSPPTKPPGAPGSPPKSVLKSLRR